jgi:hypothetical protein
MRWRRFLKESDAGKFLCRQQRFGDVDAEIHRKAVGITDIG